MKFGASKESKGMYGFDPTGLERAAKAAQILDKSANAKQAFELALKEEELKLVKEKRLLMLNEIEREKIEMINKKESVKLDIEAHKQKARYEDELAKERIEYKLYREQENNKAMLKQQEESTKRQEAEKQKTLTHEHNLKVLQDKLHLQHKYSAKAKIEKENFDLIKDKLLLNHKQQRETKLSLRQLTLNTIGKGIQTLLHDNTLYTKLLLGISSSILFTYAFTKVINISYDYIHTRLFTPKLIKETSKTNITNLRHYYKHFKTKHIHRNVLNNTLFFNNNLHNRLQVISSSLYQQTRYNKLNVFNKQQKIPFRNFLFHGPPGTGKTAFAKELALHSGMDYAIMTGADVAPLGSKAVIEINKLFDWAQLTRKGVVIFIDEADAFLRQRKEGNQSESLRNALNAFLYRTSCESNKFFFVLATNEPACLDRAIQDRIDEVVMFGLPEKEERKKIIMNNSKIYFNKDNMNVIKDNINLLVSETEKFSGREVAKCIVTIYNTCVCLNKGNITLQLLKDVMKQLKTQKRIKDKWVGLALANNSKYKH